MAAANLTLFQFEDVCRKNRVYLPHTNHLETFTEKKVLKRYRFTKESILLICDLLRKELERPTRLWRYKFSCVAVFCLGGILNAKFRGLSAELYLTAKIIYLALNNRALYSHDE
jgi:hypothetical protein